MNFRNIYGFTLVRNCTHICALSCCQSDRVADSGYRAVISVPLRSKVVLWEEWACCPACKLYFSGLALNLPCNVSKNRKVPKLLVALPVQACQGDERHEEVPLVPDASYWRRFKSQQKQCQMNPILQKMGRFVLFLRGCQLALQVCGRIAASLRNVLSVLVGKESFKLRSRCTLKRQKAWGIRSPEWFCFRKKPFQWSNRSCL